MRERGGDYFLFVKANQPGCAPSSLEHSVTFPPQDIVSPVPLRTNEWRDPPDLTRTETVDKGHGRIEIRRIAVRTVLPSRLDEKWPGFSTICRIERIRELGNSRRIAQREVICAITSLPADKLAPAASERAPPLRRLPISATRSSPSFAANLNPAKPSPPTNGPPSGWS